MGVSFKVARVGTRYRPKPAPSEDNTESENGGAVSDTQQRLHEGDYGGKGDNVADQANVSVKSGVHSVSQDLEVSFLLNLFPNGFSVAKASELFTDVPKKLHPYDRASEKLFTSIEYGWLPGDVFDGLPCKYVNGALLCEIRDYRNCLYTRSGTASAVNSPIVHKVSLQMCMENVIKDIISLSNDSWTYKDLLEVESHILKALQPVLHLKPEPLQDRFCREPLKKKLDLGITWSWKRRKLNDATASNPRFSNQCNKGVPNSQQTISSSIPNLQKNNIVLESISQRNLLTAELSYQFAERCSQSVPTDPRLSNLTSALKQRFGERNYNPSVQQTISSSVPNLQKNNIVLESISQPNLLTAEPSYQFAERCSQSVPTDPRLFNPTSALKQRFGESNHNPSVPSSVVFREQGTCETQANKRPILKMPKEEPLDFSPQHPAVSENELLKKNTLLHHEAEKIRNEIFYDKRGLSLFRNNGQQTISEGNRKLLAGMLASAVKQEPVETRDCLSLNIRLNRSNLQQLQPQQSSSMLGTNIPHANTLRDQMVYYKNARKEAGAQKRKALQSPQVTAGVRIAHDQNESLPSEVSVPAKQKKSSQPKVSSTKLGDSLAVTSNSNTTSHLQLKNCNLPQTSEVKAGPLLERFLKVEVVTQRYGLDNSKRKLDKILPEKLDFSNTTRVAYHLLDPEENWKSKDGTTARISLSECFVDRRLNKSKTRVLIYADQSYVNQGVEIPMAGSNTHVKLVMSEKFNEGFVEASVLFGHKEGIDSTRFHSLPNFHSTYSADLFAAQFTSLMVRNGYCLVHERIESTPLHDGCSSSQQVTVTGGVTPAAEAFKLPSSTSTPGPSTSMFTPITKSIQPVNYRPLPSPKLLSEGHSIPTGIIQSTQELSGCNLPKMELNTATQVSPLQQQQSMNKHAHLQFQMMQRQRQQNIGEATGGPGMVHYGGGIWGHGNIGPGSLSSVMSSGGSIQVPRGGQTPWIHNIGQFNNIPSSSDSNLLFSSISDNGTPTMTADRQGRAIMGGYSYQRVPMQTPSIQDMTYLLTNQQLLPPNQHIQGITPLVHPKLETGLLDDYIGNTSIVPINHSTPPSQLSPQMQISSGSVFPRMNRRNIVFGPRSSEQSSHTRGSVASSSVSSPRTWSGFSKMGAVKMERE